MRWNLSQNKFNMWLRNCFLRIHNGVKYMNDMHVQWFWSCDNNANPQHLNLQVTPSQNKVYINTHTITKLFFQKHRLNFNFIFASPFVCLFVCLFVSNKDLTSQLQQLNTASTTTFGIWNDGGFHTYWWRNMNHLNELRLSTCMHGY